MALLRLLRPLDVVLFFFAAALGGVLTLDPDSPEGVEAVRLLLAMGAAALVGGASNVINDVYDLDIDRINRPDRALVTGEVSTTQALLLWGGVSALGVLLGVLASPVHGAIALASVALLWAYSAFLKATAVWGNVAVAGVITLGVMYGGLAVGPPTPSLWAGAGLAFWILLAREITKDIEDVEGDRSGGATTLAVTWGERRASRLVVAMMLLAIASLPFVAAYVGESFLVYCLGMASALLAGLWPLAAASGPDGVRRAAGRASGWFKGALALGILALAFAHLA